MSSEEGRQVSDETEGNRLCLKCGVAYHGKHSECSRKWMGENYE